MGENLFDSPTNYDVNFYEVSREVNNPRNNYAGLTKEIWYPLNYERWKKIKPSNNS